jgi:hypothetical protein
VPHREAALNAGAPRCAAQDPGIHCYDAELLRPRAQTPNEPARQAGINGALELGRRQTVTLSELRAALNDFELRGEEAAAVTDAANRITAGNAFPELTRAKAALSEQMPRI